MIEIVVDADACPVKDEIYAVAARHGLRVILVANSPMRTPEDLGVELVLVGSEPDAADDWIAENTRPTDVVITADVRLAARCIAGGVPPILIVTDENGNALHLLMVDEAGGPIGPGLLDRVAEAVRVEGEIVHRDGLHYIHADESAYRRIERPGGPS